METFTENLNLFVSAGTIVGQMLMLFAGALFLLARFATGSSGMWAKKCLAEAGRWGLHLAFVIAASGTLVSLIYSEVIGFAPCELCWVQRIFLYPHVIILGLALWKNTKDAARYCLALSGIGALVALYHFYGQSFNPSALPGCDAIGGASCAVRYFVEFGYVTIPLMSLTAFLLIIIFLLLAKSAQKN